jgi:hypothetical protein
MTPAEYFALCTCPRMYNGGHGHNPRCPWHSLPIDERLKLMEEAGQ